MWAVSQFMVPEKKAAVLSGSASVRVGHFKVEADHIVYFTESREVYAEGNCRMVLGESELAAQVLYVDIKREQGYLVDAVVKASRKPGQQSSGKQLDLEREKNPAEGLAKVSREEASLLRTRDPYGVYFDSVDDPQARLNFVFKAEKVVIHSRKHLSAEKAFFTTDDMAEPFYGVTANRLDFHLQEVEQGDKPGHKALEPQKIVGQGARIKIGPFSSFPFPRVTYDLTSHMSFTSFDVGSSKQWGPYALYRIGWGLGGKEDRLFDPNRLYFDLDERLNRGPAFGSEFFYKTGIRPQDPEARKAFERGHGHLRVYGVLEAQITNDEDFDRAVRNRERRIQPKIDGFQRRTYDANFLFLKRRELDDAAPPAFGLDLYEDDERWTIDFGHHQPLRHFAGLNDVELDFKYQRQSDRDFRLDYFRNNYLVESQPEALVSARKAGDNFQAELLYRGNPQDFNGAPPRAPFDYGTFTTYEPALTYNLMPLPIGKGFYLHGTAQGARLRREFEQAIIDQDDIEVNRAYGRMELERPFRLAGMTFRPHAGGLLAGYDDSRSGDGTAQGAFLYGMDVSSRIYGTFPEFRNDELGVDGFRHIIEPRIEYLAVGDTMEDPLEILDFDAIDDLQGAHRVRFALDQTFQTRLRNKDGTSKARDFAGLLLYMDAFPRKADRDRLLDGDTFDLFHVNGYLRVIDAVTFRGDLGMALETGDVETAVYSLNFDPGGRWRLEVFERFNYEDEERRIMGSDLIGFKIDFQLSERWGLSFEQTNERTKGFLARKGKSSEKLTVRRKYGPLVGMVSYQVDENNNDHRFGVSFAPAFAYRSLVLPTENLLVPSGEVGEDSEAPEERDFDPFKLLNRKKKSKPESQKESRASRDQAPVPARPQDKTKGDPQPSVPAPPAAEKESSGLTPQATPAVAEARTAAQPRPKDRPKNLGDDDWGSGAP